MFTTIFKLIVTSFPSILISIITFPVAKEIKVHQRADKYSMRALCPRIEKSDPQL